MRCSLVALVNNHTVVQPTPRVLVTITQRKIRGRRKERGRIVERRQEREKETQEEEEEGGRATQANFLN